MTNRDDFSMAYQDSCSGMTLLLIHGFPFSSAMWEPQIEELQDIVRVLAPDLRGHGYSDAAPGPYSMEMLADDCMGLLDAIGVQEPVVVCGLSMGGYVAFEFLRQFPDWVAGLILASTRAAPDTAEGKTNRDKTAARARQEGVQAIAADMLPKLLSPVTYDEEPELAELLQMMMENTSVEGVAGASMAMKERPDSRPMLGEIDAPTLVIHGADDKIIPLAEAKTMAEAIPGAELVVIDNAGHLPNLEQPDEFNRVVWNFLQRLEEGES